MAVPTPDELREILATILAGAAGGTIAKWRLTIGPVEKLPTWQNPRSNWTLNPISDVDTVLTAAAIVRAEHPYVADRVEPRP